jgi:hypothetical protein
MTDEQSLSGKTIKAAFSSLTNFACEFDDGSGLLLEAAEGPTPRIDGNLVEANALPRDNDAVCRVDWSWIVGSKINRAKLTENAAQLQLDKAGPLTISVQMWQGKPFLAFQPFRPA